LAVDEQAAIHGHVHARLRICIAHPGGDEDRWNRGDWRA
jgi:UDP-2,3-diacylglucosamine pyrophosphatase LpxH